MVQALWTTYGYPILDDEQHWHRVLSLKSATLKRIRLNTTLYIVKVERRRLTPPRFCLSRTEAHGSFLRFRLSRAEVHRNHLKFRPNRAEAHRSHLKVERRRVDVAWGTSERARLS